MLFAKNSELEMQRCDGGWTRKLVATPSVRAWTQIDQQNNRKSAGSACTRLTLPVMDHA
jgi:hypothetical protein